MRKTVKVRHSGELADGGLEWFRQWSWGHMFLSAPHLEEADQDTECGGQLYPGSISGHLIDCGVRELQKVLIWGQGLRHTAHHHGYDSKSACRDQSGHV